MEDALKVKFDIHNNEISIISNGPSLFFLGAESTIAVKYFLHKYLQVRFVPTEQYTSSGILATTSVNERVVVDEKLLALISKRNNSS